MSPRVCSHGTISLCSVSTPKGVQTFRVIEDTRKVLSVYVTFLRFTFKSSTLFRITGQQPILSDHSWPWRNILCFEIQTRLRTLLMSLHELGSYFYVLKTSYTTIVLILSLTSVTLKIHPLNLLWLLCVFAVVREKWSWRSTHLYNLIVCRFRGTKVYKWKISQDFWSTT